MYFRVANNLDDDMPTTTTAQPCLVTREIVELLLARARTLARSNTDAWDLVQDTLAKTLEKPPRRLVPETYLAWLRVVLKNVHLDRIRTAAWRAAARSCPISPEALASSPPSEIPMWRQVDFEQIEKSLQRLRPDDRRILLMQTRERRSLQEIGRALNICPATVATRAHRARAHLREIVLEDLARTTPGASGRRRIFEAPRRRRTSNGGDLEIRNPDTELMRARPAFDDVPAVL
jgi:RNA polymerase sigma factor (sigma-70 family)